MGNEIFIQNKRVCIKPLRSRLEAIQKLQPPTTVKGCRNFAGMVNFLVNFARVTKIIKTNISLNQKRQTICLGKGTTRFF